MIGETVTVEPEGAEVADVLVQPGSGVQPTDPCAPPGSPIVARAHFPKAFGGELRGRQVLVRGRLLDVVGDPLRYQRPNTPTRWDMAADLADLRMGEPFELYREGAGVDALGDPASTRSEVLSGTCRVIPSGSSDSEGAADSARATSAELWARWTPELGALCLGDTRGLLFVALGRSYRVSQMLDVGSEHRTVRILGEALDG